MTENIKQNEPEPRDIRGSGWLHAGLGLLVGLFLSFIYFGPWRELSFEPAEVTEILYDLSPIYLFPVVGGLVGGAVGREIGYNNRNALIGAGLGGAIGFLLLFAVLNLLAPVIFS